MLLILRAFGRELQISLERAETDAEASESVHLGADTEVAGTDLDIAAVPYGFAIPDPEPED